MIYPIRGACEVDTCKKHGLIRKMEPVQEPELLVIKNNAFNMNTGKAKSQKLVMKGIKEDMQMGTAVYKLKGFIAFSGRSRMDGSYDVIIKEDDE